MANIIVLIPIYTNYYIYLSRIGIPQTGTNGLGIVLVIGFNLEPRPPTRINAFIINHFNIITIGFEFERLLSSFY